MGTVLGALLAEVLVWFGVFCVTNAQPIRAYYLSWLRLSHSHDNLHPAPSRAGPPARRLICLHAQPTVLLHARPSAPTHAHIHSPMHPCTCKHTHTHTCASVQTHPDTHTHAPPTHPHTHTIGNSLMLVASMLFRSLRAS